MHPPRPLRLSTDGLEHFFPPIKLVLFFAFSFPYLQGVYAQPDPPSQPPPTGTDGPGSNDLLIAMGIIVGTLLLLICCGLCCGNVQTRKPVRDVERHPRPAPATAPGSAGNADRERAAGEMPTPPLKAYTKDDTAGVTPRNDDEPNPPPPYYPPPPLPPSVSALKKAATLPT